MEDYKLATANASLNAEFSAESQAREVSYVLSNMSLEDDEESKQNTVKHVNQNDKKSTAKEVRNIDIYLTEIFVNYDNKM